MERLAEQWIAVLFVILTTVNKLFGYTHLFKKHLHAYSLIHKSKNRCYCLCSWSHDHNSIIGPWLRLANKSSFVCFRLWHQCYVNQLTENTEIIKWNNDVNRLQIAEAVIIKTYNPKINRQDTGMTRTLKLFSDDRIEKQITETHFIP